MFKKKNLAFMTNDNGKDRKDNLGKNPTRIDERDVAAVKMFGKKRKGIILGKKFKQKGKDAGNKKPISAKQDGNTKGSVGPSLAEFDSMVSTAAKNFKKSNKSMLKKG